MSSASAVPTALVLAAGQSTRIQAVAPDCPKPLIVVAGETVLERNLRQLAAAGVHQAWINLHYRGEQIEALIGDGRAFGLRVEYSWEPALLGTAGAAKKLEAALAAGTFFFVYGGKLTAPGLGALAPPHHTPGAPAAIAAV